MATRRFQVLIEWDTDDQVWVTSVPALGHVSTFGDTREEALAMTKEAILGYIEAAAKEGLQLTSSDGSAELVDIDVAVS